MLDAPLEHVRGQIFNVGSEKFNTSKKELIEMIKVNIPQLKVEDIDTSFLGDMCSIYVSFEKIRRILKLEAQISLEQGIEELLFVLKFGVISSSLSEKYWNHPVILV